ncbi:3-hydroxyacyl-CoA dehydrogenase family protein [Terrabacter terrigena]
MLGGGTMGRGIALTVARGSHLVRLVDKDPSQLAAAQQWVGEYLRGSVERGKLDAAEADRIVERLTWSADPADASDSELVIEALPESLSLKRQVLSAIQHGADHPVTIHTNTSTLAISDIAEGLPAPELCIGTHYCNPAPIMPLVEVALGDATEQATVDSTLHFLTSIGKTPVVLKDRPGLITNYLVVAFENDAVRALETGLATAAEIDRVTLESMRFPIGPFRLLDIVGLDVHVAVSQSLREQLDDEQYTVPQTIHDMVARGDLGVKTGRGFYDYPVEAKA